MNHIQHTLRQPGLVQQLSYQQRGTGIAFGGFEDEAIATRDGQRVHPQRHHGREVEWSDTGNDTQRLEIRPRINVRPDITTVFPLEYFRRGTGVFHVFNTALQFARSIFQGLAVFFTDQLSNARFVLLQQLLEAEHHLSALGWRCITPGRKRSLGRIDRLLDRVPSGKRYCVDNLAGRRIEHICGAAIFRNELAVDQVLNAAHGKLRIIASGANDFAAHATKAPV